MSRIQCVLNNATVHDTLDTSTEWPTPDIRQLHHNYSDLCEYLDKRKDNSHVLYLGLLANIEYYRMLLQDKLMNKDGPALPHYGVKSMLENVERKELDRQRLDLHNRRISVLRPGDHVWEDPSSRMLIILPSDSETWLDLNPRNHHFQLYCLCFCFHEHQHPSSMGRNSEHVHISRLQGYDLLHPLEFFETYGDYVLASLEMVRSGLASSTHNIPSLDTCKILDGSDAEATGSRLSMATFGPLVDKAIAYFRNLLPRNQSPNGAFESVDSKQVRKHLSVNGRG